VDSVRQFEKDFVGFLDSEFPDVPHEIRRSKDLTEDTEAKLKKALVEFTEMFKKKLQSEVQSEKVAKESAVPA
jgi:F-type H+-transporting ATPase subunit alpha